MRVILNYEISIKGLESWVFPPELDTIRVLDTITAALQAAGFKGSVYDVSNDISLSIERFEGKSIHVAAAAPTIKR